MFRFGQQADPQKQFVVNKGNIEVVNHGDYKVAYDYALEGYVSVRTRADTVEVEVKKDVPNASVYLNSGGIEECRVSVGAGILKAGQPSSNSNYKLGSGTMDVKIERSSMGKVSGKVDSGILKNSSNLDEHDVHNGAPFGYNPFMMDGIPSFVELTGDVDGALASFEVGVGTLDIHG